MFTYRQMIVNDIPAGLRLCRSAGWNQLDRDWELFLKLSPKGCIVAIDQTGKVVGTVTTICYENHFCWIGMVLVDPAFKRQGIGTALLHKAIDILDSQNTIKLDATPAGREVYLKLQFVDEYGLSRMHHQSLHSVEPHDSEVKSIAESEFSTLLDLDRQSFGADRRSLLEWIWKGSPDLAYVITRDGIAKAFCFGRSGHNYTQIGPVVADDIDLAKQVALAALQHCKGLPVIIDVLHHSPWMKWLSSIGFIEQRPFTRMYRGRNQWPGNRDKQFAILGPEFG